MAAPLTAVGSPMSCGSAGQSMSPSAGAAAGGGGGGGGGGAVTIEDLSQVLLRLDERLVPEAEVAAAAAAASGAPSPRKLLASGRGGAESPTATGKHLLLNKSLVPMDGAGGRPKEVLEASEVLDFVFPPQPAEGYDGYYTRVSREGASTLDVIALQEQLDLRLRLRSARPDGVCPQREDVTAQCFDELIRQVTVSCPERGLLLARVRDEIHMTIDGYRALVDTASSLGMRKALHRKIQHEIEKDLLELEYDVQIQQKRVQALAAKLDKTKKIIEDRKKLQEAQHEEEVRFVKKGNVQLSNELKRLTAASAG